MAMMQVQAVTEPNSCHPAGEVRAKRLKDADVWFRLDSGLIVDIPREQWAERPDDIWVDIPAGALRQISK